MSDYKEFIVKETFKKVALSHYGYDGGNIKSQIWFSGLEWGGGISPTELSKHLLRGAIVKPPSCEGLEDRRQYLSYPFDRKLLKILAAAIGQPTADYKKMVEDGVGAYSQNGPMFKLNLYPVSFKTTCDSYWTREFYDLTGFPTKELYRAWIQTHRFQFFNELVVKHKPQVIVCCGTSYIRDFLMAFGGVETIYSQPIAHLKLKGKSDVRVFESKISPSTKIIVTPFFGNRYGINKDEECDKIGKFISSFFSESNLAA